MSAPDPIGGGTSQPSEPLLSHQLSSVPPETPDTVQAETPSKEEAPEPHLSWKTWLIGDLNWWYFIMPLSLYAKNRRGHTPMRFRRDFEFVPLVMTVLLGLQHACVALGYIVAGPLFFITMFPFGTFGRYYIHAAILIGGICSLLQCVQIKIPRTPYQIGTGLSSFLGGSTIMRSVFFGLIWRIAEDDNSSLTHAYGKVLGTAAVISLFFIALSLIPRKYAKVLFPPSVCGIMITLIGIEVVATSLSYWGGGPGCQRSASVPCLFNGNVELPFGSPEYIGLGFFAMMLFLAFELFGSAFSRHLIIILPALIVYAVSSVLTKHGSRYVTGDEIDNASNISFLWTTTYHLGFDKSAVMPLIGAFLVTYLQATAILTATIEESGLNISGAEEDMRIQGGLITTGIASLFAVLATGMPVVPIPQNNSVIHMSRIASRYAGLAGAIWLLIFGIFGRILAFIFLEIPIVVRGGIFVLVSANVVLTGIKILSRLKWDRRTSVIVFYSLAIGLGNLVVYNFINDDLWPLGSDPTQFEESFRYAVISAMRTPFFNGGIAAIILHLVLPKDMELGYIDTLPELRE